MFCIFFSVDRVITQFVVPKGQTVNANLYGNEILPKVFSNFMEKRGRTTVRDVMLYHDNAARIVTEYLRNERVELLPHPGWQVAVLCRSAKARLAVPHPATPSLA